MNKVRIFVILSNLTNEDEEIERVLKEEPAHLFTTDVDVKSTEVIPLRAQDITFYPLDEVGKEIPLSKENICNFKIAKWVGDSGTGDFDFVVYGRYDG